MTILICGASGLVGKELCQLLDEKSIPYYGTYNTNKINKSNMFKLNFLNINEVETFLLQKKISICVFSIVQRVTDICEQDWNSIKETNINFVHITSYICNKLNIKFIHLSTDYVFDGSKQPNYPNDLKNPLQNYGISKLISEFKVLTNCKNYCIIRTPVLYSALSSIHNNAVCMIGKNIMNLTKKNIKEDNYNIRRPLYIKDLCNFILDCFTKKSGIYHFYNPFNKFTKFQMSKIISNYLEINTNHILPNDSKNNDIAPRPFDTQLCDNKFDINKYTFSNFNKTIDICFKNFKHPKINKNNYSNFFFIIDLDDTIIESNNAHYNAYQKVLNKYNKPMLEYNDWKNIILTNNINNYLKKIFNDNDFLKIKKEKIEELKKEDIKFTKNSENFIKFLITNNINFCIVTNTSKTTVTVFKQKLSLLNEIKQWIYRDDYILPKPNKECIELAIKKYYKNEKFIVGIEDSFVGYKALKYITDIIYIYRNKELFKKNDCYLFNDFMQIFNE